MRSACHILFTKWHTKQACHDKALLQKKQTNSSGAVGSGVCTEHSSTGVLRDWHWMCIAGLHWLFAPDARFWPASEIWRSTGNITEVLRENAWNPKRLFAKLGTWNQ
jgi:hypothetical protein